MALTSPTIRIGGQEYSVDVPHLAFATAIAGWAAWYGRDSWLASQEVENLILIAPASVIAVVLYGFVAAGCVRRTGSAEIAKPAKHEGASGPKIAVTMALLAIFAIVAPQIGFDIASYLYVLAMLLFLGERRIIVLLLLPAAFAAVVIFGFGTLLDTPLPLLLIGDGS